MPIFESECCIIGQFALGWSAGEKVDDQAKTHPLLKPYKALSEKVPMFFIISGTEQLLAEMIM